MGKIRSLEQILHHNAKRKSKKLVKQILKTVGESTKTWKGILKATKKYLKQHGKKKRTK